MNYDAKYLKYKKKYIKLNGGCNFIYNLLGRKSVEVLTEPKTKDQVLADLNNGKYIELLDLDLLLINDEFANNIKSINFIYDDNGSEEPLGNFISRNTVQPAYPITNYIFSLNTLSIETDSESDRNKSRKIKKNSVVDPIC